MARAISQEVFVSGAELINPIEALRLVTVPRPEAAAAGQVVVRLLVRPVHQVDLNWVAASELQRHAGKGRPVVLGSEAVGVVEYIGDGVTSVKPGDRVVPLLFFYYLYDKAQGAWQDYVEVAEQHVLPVPSGIPDDVAAQFICNPWSAYGLLVDLAIPRGGYLLQNGAGSVLGRQIIQLAKHWGIKTINLVRRDSVKEELKALGADEVINTATADVEKQVKEITDGVGADGAVEMVGGLQTKIVAASLKSGGKLLSVGSVVSLDRDFELWIKWSDLHRDVELKSWGLLKFIRNHDLKQIAQDVWKLLEDKVIEPLVGDKFDLADYERAIEASRNTAGNSGKVLLVNLD